MRNFKEYLSEPLRKYFTLFLTAVTSLGYIVSIVSKGDFTYPLILTVIGIVWIAGSYVDYIKKHKE